MRRRFKAFGMGTIRFLLSDNPRVLAFVREHEVEKILVVVNLSRYAQAAELDLKEYAGLVPEEVFSGSRFPPIRNKPNVLTPATNDYYSFVLQKDAETAGSVRKRKLPELQVKKGWQEIFDKKYRVRFEEQILPAYFLACRRFGAKNAKIRAVRVLDRVAVPSGNQTACVLITEVSYVDRPTDGYLLPIGFAEKEQAAALLREAPRAVIARLSVGGSVGILFDGVYGPGLRAALLELISKKDA